MSMQNNHLAVVDQQTPAVMNNASLLLSVDVMDRVMKIADVMAQGVATVPKHLQGKPSDCLAIVMQAARWGMDPFVVGQKTHLVNGQLGYEAQLVNAVVTSSNAVRGRFNYEYGGNWEKIVGVQDKDKRDESGLFIRVGAILRGETDITWGEPLYLSDITTRNSPLWKTAPKQQIAYLAVKYWARMYCPEVIMGVYSPDELEPRAERDITPPRVSLKEIAAEPSTVSTAQEAAGNIDVLADEIRDRISAAETTEQARAIGDDIAAQRSLLGAALFTELKNKAVMRHHQLKTCNTLEGLINTLPNPDEPGAAERFAEVERKLATAKSHLGAELYEQFSTTITDMRPEYIAD